MAKIVMTQTVAYDKKTLTSGQTYIMRYKEAQSLIAAGKGTQKK